MPTPACSDIQNSPAQVMTMTVADLRAEFDRMTHETGREHDSIGTWSTGTRAINAIPFMCAAKPGLLSPLDLPLARMIKLH